MNINSLILGGIVIDDGKWIHIDNRKCYTFHIKNKRKEKEPFIFKVIAFGEAALSASDNISKDNEINIVGEIKTIPESNDVYIECQHYSKEVFK